MVDVSPTCMNGDICWCNFQKLLFSVRVRVRSFPVTQMGKMPSSQWGYFRDQYTMHHYMIDPSKWPYIRYISIDLHCLILKMGNLRRPPAFPFWVMSPFCRFSNRVWGYAGEWVLGARPLRTPLKLRYTPKFNSEFTSEKWWLEDYLFIGKVTFQGLY